MEFVIIIKISVMGIGYRGVTHAIWYTVYEMSKVSESTVMYQSYLI